MIILICAFNTISRPISNWIKFTLYRMTIILSISQTWDTFLSDQNWSMFGWHMKRNYGNVLPAWPLLYHTHLCGFKWRWRIHMMTTNCVPNAYTSTQSPMNNTEEEGMTLTRKYRCIRWYPTGFARKWAFSCIVKNTTTSQIINCRDIFML